MTTASERSLKTNLAYLYPIHMTESNSTDNDIYYIWQAIALDWFCVERHHE